MIYPFGKYISIAAYLLVLGFSLHVARADEASNKFTGRIEFNAKDSSPSWPKPATAPAGAPNVVIILLDDVGFGAPSTAGGPVNMPALDALAKRGLRYNNFHSTALCSPTRAALLSGRNDHQVGFGTVADGASGYPGYNAIWKKETASIAEILRRNGYSTAAFGKWHNTPPWEIGPLGPFDRWPTGLGFEYFYGFMSGAISQWEPPLYRNTTPVEPPKSADEGYQVSADLADDAIRWVQTHQSLAPQKPYFLYFATGVAHSPHHAPKEWIEKYKGKFDMGWDKLREKIYLQQKKLGVIPANAELTPRPKELVAWDSLSPERRRLLARQMEVYAAHLEYNDHQLSRLLSAIQNGPGGDNTLIIYLAGDNGAEGASGAGGAAQDGYDLQPYTLKPVTLAERLEHIDELGAVDHYNHYAIGWAWATSSPFQWMKTTASHFGGTRNMVVVSWPERIKDFGGLRPQFTHVNAVAATLYEVIGIEFPSSVDGVKQKELAGPSFAYTFDNASEPSRHKLQIFEQLGNRAIYKDGWVASAMHAFPWQQDRSDDFSNDRWELYHVAEDFSQAHDLATKYPEKLEGLKKLFDAEARKNDIYPLSNSFSSVPFGTGQPPLPGGDGRREFTFYPGLPRLPVSYAPDFRGSHRISADAVISEKGEQGAIISLGSRLGGFAFYIKKNKLIYESNFRGRKHDLIVSKADVPAGHVRLAYEFVRDESQVLGGGEGRLFINGEMVAKSVLPRFEPPLFYKGASENFSIGRVYGSPVSPDYRAPFEFSGQLKKVQIELFDGAAEKKVIGSK